MWRPVCHGNLDTKGTIMKLSKLRLKRMIREEYNRIRRKRRITEATYEGYDEEIVASYDTERLIVTKYTDGFVQIEIRYDGAPSIDVEPSELPDLIAILQKLEAIK